MTALRPEAHRASPAAAGVPVRLLTGVRGALAAAVDGPLVAVGISHRTATVALREQAALGVATAA